MNETVKVATILGPNGDPLARGAVALREEPRQVAQPTGDGAEIINMIERAARDKNVDIDKFERLVELRERMEANAAKKAFAEAMALVQAELPQIVRRAENSQTNSTYAALEAIGEAIDPIITKHGFSQTFAEEDSPKEGCRRIICDLLHKDGHEKKYHVDMPIDIAGIAGKVNKTQTHAFASTVTYSRRVLTMMIFNVKSRKAMPDDDGNAAGGADLITEEQVQQIQQMLIRTGSNVSRFLEMMGAQRIEDIRASAFNIAMNMLKAKEQRA